MKKSVSAGLDNSVMSFSHGFVIEKFPLPKTGLEKSTLVVLTSFNTTLGLSVASLTKSHKFQFSSQF